MESLTNESQLIFLFNCLTFLTLLDYIIMIFDFMIFINKILFKEWLKNLFQTNILEFPKISCLCNIKNSIKHIFLFKYAMLFLFYIVINSVKIDRKRTFKGTKNF